MIRYSSPRAFDVWAATLRSMGGEKVKFLNSTDINFELPVPG
jgi:hypothetical protein